MKLLALLAAFALLALVALADGPSALPAAPVEFANPFAASALDGDLVSLLAPLLLKWPKLAALLALIATVRVPMKLWMTWLERRARADGRMDWLDGVVDAPWYRALHWLLDATLSVKLDVLRSAIPTASHGPLAVLLCGGLALGLLPGCASYQHARFTDAGQPIERTSLRAPFLTKTTLENLRSRVSDKRGTNVYTRSLGLDAAESRADSEGIAALESLLGRALVEGLKTGAKP